MPSQSLRHITIFISFCFSIAIQSRLELCDSAEGASGGAGGPPVTELAVLPGLHEVLPATVVWVLVEGPVAVHDIAGIDVTAPKMILHRLAVLTELHHLTLEVGSLVDAHAVGPLAGLDEHSSKVKHKIRVASVPLQLCMGVCEGKIYWKLT